MSSASSTDFWVAPSAERPNRLCFDSSPESIASLSETLIERSRSVLDRVVKVPHAERTFANTMLPLAEEEREFGTLSSNCEFPAHVSPLKEVRDASSEAEKRLNEYLIEASMREDIFEAVNSYWEAHKSEESLCAESRRLVERMLRDFQRAGLALPTEKREEVKTIKKRLSELSIEFQKNLNEDTSAVLLTREELTGMPDDFLEGLCKEGNLYKVTMKYPDVLPCLKYVKDPSVRARLEHCYSTRVQKRNTEIMEEMLKLRHELACKMGFDTFADFMLEIRMAKRLENLKKFYDDLCPRLEPLAIQEEAALVALKKAELGDRSDGDHLNAWDWSYYHRVAEENLGVDNNQIKEYFPLHRVTSKILEIYQELLSLRYERVEKPHVWHPDVEMYAVYDVAGEKKDNEEFLGHFYLDLFPREGKYGHAAAFPLQPGCELSDGSRQRAVTAMVCNFSKPTKDRPSLLRHNEVVTFFHEFGHVMHGVCARVKYSRFHGTAVERDFVECPSQMLENWCWDESILERISGHYKDESKPLPKELLQKMLAAKNLNSGLVNLRQVFFGMFDQKLHSQPESDTQAIYGELRNKITHVRHTPGTNPTAQFGHIAGGYEASYYSYLWAEVFSADLFEQFKLGGVMNTDLGLKYRREILQVGGSRDAAESLQAFLGRDPIPAPFLRSIGLAVGE